MVAQATVFHGWRRARARAMVSERDRGIELSQAELALNMATADKDDTQAALAALMANSIAADSAARERRAPIQALVDTIKAVSEAITHLEQRQDLLEDAAEGAQGDY
jgi:hypothetical protein